MKMLKLVQNETIKTIKKTSTKVMIILAIVALFGAVGFSKLVMSLNNFVGTIEFDWKEEMTEDIKRLKEDLKDERNHYDVETIANLEAQIETYELAVENDVNYLYYNSYYWKTELLNNIQMEKTELKLMAPTSENAEELEKHINDEINMLRANDYSKYIEYQKNNMKNSFDNKEISQEEYENEIYMLDLQKKYGIFNDDNDETSWKRDIYREIRIMRENLSTGINSITGKMLKVEEVEELKENIEINLYRLENNIPTLQFLSSERIAYDMYAPAFCLLIISILMIIITGSAISSEISKGTIKFLLFTPNKRWKILLSKLISATIILIVLSLIMSVLSVLIGNIFFEEKGLEYLYMQNGEVKALNNISYTALYFLISCIDIFIYMLFALMLSTITKNTALSVGVSIACYVGSGTVMQIINMLITADWVKFIPFNNFGLVDRIFINNSSYTMAQYSLEAMNNVSIGFSLAILGVCAMLMLVTMFDSFNKRDIV